MNDLVKKYQEEWGVDYGMARLKAYIEAIEKMTPKERLAALPELTGEALAFGLAYNNVKVRCQNRPVKRVRRDSKNEIVATYDDVEHLPSVSFEPIPVLMGSPEQTVV